jgi:hypothetical protein
MLLCLYLDDFKSFIQYFFIDRSTHFMPYVDDLFIEGVSIRNIKNLSNEDELKLKSICDNIYRDVMQPGRSS